MMCPVLVANEMSGPNGRVEVTSHPYWRLAMDGGISGPSFGAGNENQGSHHTSDERTDQLVAGGRNYRNQRPRRPLTGMMLHVDGSRHRWIPGLDHAQDLVVIFDDATAKCMTCNWWTKSRQGFDTGGPRHRAWCSR
jgi:hypothetical protein